MGYVSIMLIGGDFRGHYLSEGYYLKFDTARHGQARKSRDQDVEPDLDNDAVCWGDAEPFTITEPGRRLNRWEHPLQVTSANTAYTLPCGQYLACGMGVRDKPFLYLSRTDRRRWELAAAVMHDHLRNQAPQRHPTPDSFGAYRMDDCTKDYGFARALVRRSSNISTENFRAYLSKFGEFDGPMDSYRFEKPELDDEWEPYLLPSLSERIGQSLALLKAQKLFVPLAAAYGGIHLTVWGTEYPSRRESFLWKISCFIIMGGPFVLWSGPAF